MFYHLLLLFLIIGILSVDIKVYGSESDCKDDKNGTDLDSDCVGACDARDKAKRKYEENKTCKDADKWEVVGRCKEFKKGYYKVKGCIGGGVGAALFGIGIGLMVFGVVFCICCCWICIPIGLLLCLIGCCICCC